MLRFFLEVYLFIIFLTPKAWTQTYFCQEVLDITTDYEMYPGIGKVRICVDNNDNLIELIILKPVENPNLPNPKSSYYDERFPKLNINLEQINSMTKPTPFIKPQRLGFYVDAAWIALHKNKAISASSGGKLEVHVLKNALTNTKHILVFSLKKIYQRWEVKIWNNTEANWLNVESIHLDGGFTGVKTIDIR